MLCHAHALVVRMLRVALVTLTLLALTPAAHAAEKKSFKIAWSIYVGWMPWDYAAESGILKKWADKFNAQPGDLMLLLAGETYATRKQLNELRLLMGDRLGFRDKNKFSALWVLDFPLLEWNEETNRYHAMHHPFTSPKPEDIKLLDTDPGKVRANAYDMVINGTEVGGGSIRIHDRPTQQMMFSHLDQNMGAAGSTGESFPEHNFVFGESFKTLLRCSGIAVE